MIFDKNLIDGLDLILRIKFKIVREQNFLKVRNFLLKLKDDCQNLPFNMKDFQNLS